MLRSIPYYYPLAVSLMLSMFSMSSIFVVKMVQEGHSFISIDRYRALALKRQVKLAIVMPYIQRDSDRWVSPPTHDIGMAQTYPLKITFLPCLTWQ